VNAGQFWFRSSSTGLPTRSIACWSDSVIFDPLFQSRPA
jgi:hypothetical protein